MDFSRQEYWSRLPFPSPGDRTWVYPHCGQILYHLHHQGSNKNSKCSGHCLTRLSGMSSLLPREWLLRACTWEHLQGATLGPGGLLSAPRPPLGRKNREHLRDCLSWGEGAWIRISELPTDSLEISLRLGLCLKQSPLHNFSLCPFPDSLHCLPWEHNLDTIFTQVHASGKSPT